MSQLTRDNVVYNSNDEEVIFLKINENNNLNKSSCSACKTIVKSNNVPISDSLLQLVSNSCSMCSSKTKDKNIVKNVYSSESEKKFDNFKNNPKIIEFVGKESLRDSSSGENNLGNSCKTVPYIPAHEKMIQNISNGDKNDKIFENISEKNSKIQHIDSKIENIVQNDDFLPPPSKRIRQNHESISPTVEIVKIRGKTKRELVAERDIGEGEIILKEFPLIVGPMSKYFPLKKRKSGDEEKKFRAICLGCYKNVTSGYKCSRCKFPMCSSACEQVKDHADFECEIFATNPVSPIVDTNEYKKIKVLRTLLLREKDPESWRKIMDLDSHAAQRRINLCAVSTTIALFKFIQQECHLKGFDGETINHVVGVNTVNSFNTCHQVPYPISDLTNNELIKASLLFYKSSLLTHSCYPNTRCIISQSTSASTPTFQITVLASTKIKKGTVLTHSYSDLTRGTFQRRSELQEHFYLSCKCRRCIDPAELCTFFSALKCPRPNCSQGHLLPGNPLSLDPNSLWLCTFGPTVCDFRISTTHVLDLLQEVRRDIENAAVEHSLFQEYDNLKSVLCKYKDKILSPTHFYIMDIQYALITVVNQLLELVNEEEALQLSREQIELCKSTLDVVNVLRPGNNKLRGNLLYFLHEGLLLTFLVEAKDKMSLPNNNFNESGKKDFESILKIMKLGKDFLEKEPIGSKEFARAQKLEVDSSSRLQSLIRYFNINYDELTK